MTTDAENLAAVDHEDAPLLEPKPIHAPARVQDEGPGPASRAPVGASPLDKISELLARGITVDMLDQFLEMQAKWEAREAEKAFLRAMTAFKAEGGIPEIVKGVHVHYESKRNPGVVVNYHHEELADVVSAVLIQMARFGLTHSWKPIQEGQGNAQLVKVRTVLRHTAGHSEEVELFAAPDDSGGKNSIQAVKSTVTYLERIGLLAILGLAAKGQDDDGLRAAGPPPMRDDGPSAGRRGKPETAPPRAADSPRPSGVITDKQAGLLGYRLQEKGIDRATFCDLYGVPDLEDLPRERMDEALKWIGAQR